MKTSISGSSSSSEHSSLSGLIEPLTAPAGTASPVERRLTAFSEDGSGSEGS